MSSSGIDYVDIYEEFVSFTTAKSTEDGAPPEFITIKTEREDSPILSPLRALTPPSPVHLVPVQLSPKSLSQQEATPQGTVIQLYSTLRRQAPDYFEAVEQPSYEKSKIMCDTEDPTAPSIVVSTSGGTVTQGKQTSGESNISTIHGTGQHFLSASLLPPPQQQQQHHHQGNPFQLHAHGMGMEAHNSQLHHHPQIHSNVHVHQNPFNNHVQHPMMENHVHPQQLNTGQQMNAHQLVHSSPPSHPHHTQIHHHSTSQQMIPFGMHLNPNNVGNGNTFVNHQLNPFHPPHHQMSNQQAPHGGNPYQQHPCYMQHPAACMHLQQHHATTQSMSALGNNRGVAASVGWMTGPQPVSISSSGTTGNSTFRSGPSTKGPKAHSNPGNHVVPDPTALPGGLDVLWREVPVECQRLMVPQDIPDTARFRGYFTVCELIALKRALTTRLGCGELPPITHHVTFAPIKSAVKEEGRRGTKRGSKSDGNGNVKVVVKMRNENEDETHNLENINNFNGGLCETTMDADGDSDMQDCEDTSGGEHLVSLDNLKDGIHTTICPAVTGVCVGGAVKEALDTLSSDQQHNGNSSVGNDQIGTQVVDVATREAEEDAVVESDKDLTASGDVPQESTPSSDQKEPCEETRDGGVSTSTEATSLPSMPSLPSLSSIFPEKVSSEVCVTCEPTIDDKDSTNDEDNLHEVAAEICVSASGEVIPSPITTSTVHINTSVPPGTCCVPVENRYAGAPPPYRTATLVVKLLQIGAYQIRSFSTLNPNRLRVLFNTQRMTYECQLPVVRPSPASGGAHPLRKVLTVDIGFDQVSMMKFGPDKLYMKIEGAPLLTVSYNPAQEEHTFQVLSPHDQYLLDQIDRGQLKLSPCHHLSFLNERLVQQLESQFREHPRFRHLLLSRN